MLISSKQAMFALALASLGAVAQAQDLTVGGLLEAGGKKLSKDEMSKLIPGSTSSGIVASFPHRKGMVTYYADKTSKGNTSDADSGLRPRGIFGNWDIDESGNLCFDIQTTARGKANDCNAWYQLGERYYTAKSHDPKEHVYLREISR